MASRQPNTPSPFYTRPRRTHGLGAATGAQAATPAKSPGRRRLPALLGAATAVVLIVASVALAAAPKGGPVSPLDDATSSSKSRTDMAGLPSVEGGVQSSLDVELAIDALVNGTSGNTASVGGNATTQLETCLVLGADVATHVTVEHATLAQAALAASTALRADVQTRLDGAAQTVLNLTGSASPQVAAQAAATAAAQADVAASLQAVAAAQAQLTSALSTHDDVAVAGHVKVLAQAQAQLRQDLEALAALQVDLTTAAQAVAGLDANESAVLDATVEADSQLVPQADAALRSTLELALALGITVNDACMPAILTTGVPFFPGAGAIAMGALGIVGASVMLRRRKA